MITWVPLGRVKLGLPASWFIPSFAMITPLPVAIELAMPGARGLPSEAWTSATASGSCSGWEGPAGLKGQVAALAAVDRRGAATALLSGESAEPGGCM